MVRVQDLHVARDVDLTGFHFTLARRLQDHALRRVRNHVDGNLLEVQDNGGHVLADALNRREFVNDTINLDAGNRRTLQR